MQHVAEQFVRLRREKAKRGVRRPFLAVAEGGGRVYTKYKCPSRKQDSFVSPNTYVLCYFCDTALSIDIRFKFGRKHATGSPPDRKLP